MRSANPLRIILAPALQQEWQYPGLLARGTPGQHGLDGPIPQGFALDPPKAGGLWKP